MKTVYGANKMKAAGMAAHKNMGEYSQHSANRGTGGKTTKPSKGSRAKASMHHGPYGGKKPQS